MTDGHFREVDLTAVERQSYRLCMAISDAARTGTWEIVTHLVEEGATTIAMNKIGFFIEEVTDFAKEARLNKLNRQLYTAVKYSNPTREQSGALDDVNHLLADGASANATPLSAFEDPFWDCALIKAVENGSARIPKALIDHGAAVLATSQRGDNLLHIAAENINDDHFGNVIYTLCQAEVPIDAPNDDGVRPLDLIRNAVASPMRRR